jgi:hypothetical protein
MKNIMFSIPATRVPRATFGLSTADENFFKVLWESFRLKSSYLMDHANKVDKFAIVCTSDQFANFIILRNKYGVANWIKELDAKIIGEEISEKTNRIDVTKGTPHMIGIDYAYSNGKPRWYDKFMADGGEFKFSNAMNFAGNAEAIIPKTEMRDGNYVPPSEPILLPQERDAIRDSVLEEVAVLFDERAAKARAKETTERYHGKYSFSASIVKRNEASAKIIREMKGGRTADEAQRENAINFWREMHRKFYIKVDGLQHVAYFVDATPRNIVKLDGAHTYYGDHDLRLDWSSVRPAGGRF